ncbi:MAG TPA: helix-turn-helix domain-containing protein [Candidatus Acidoferrales bacterium]|nr:helix-turn-helix domain-containing protein [Candidatus Acidoferrales bacterium]
MTRCLSIEIPFKEQAMDNEQNQTKPADLAGSIFTEAEDQPIASLRSVRAQVECKAILAALKRTGWNRKQAARMLKISYRGLLYKIRQHNITAA